MNPDTKHHTLTRRALARGAVWTLPTAVISTAAPAIAASLRKDPGINGWVSTSSRAGSCGVQNSSIQITSIGTGATPDGAPFGLYLYDTDDVTTATGATLTFWVLGNHGTTGTTAITWSAASGHSSYWTSRGRVGTAQKPDGLTYTGYRWAYTCPIDPRATTVGADGVERVTLGNFRVASNSFAQPTGSCGKLNFWTERTITLDGVPYTFQRRAGSDGAYPAPRLARSAGASPAADGTEARTALS